MTSRERVLRALSHKEPDRVPIDIGGKACNMTSKTLFRIKDHFGITSDDIWNRPFESAAFYNDEVVERLGSDFRHIFLMPSDLETLQKGDDGIIRLSEDGTISNEWGFQYKFIDGMSTIVNAPLAEAEISDIATYPWPDPKAPGRTAGLVERARHLFEETDYAVEARAVSHGFFELSHELRGFENFLMDLYINKDFAHTLLDKMLEIQMEMYSVLLQNTGKYVHVVQTADDYGMQTGLLMSPEIWREFMKPRRKALNEHIQSLAPQAKIFHHTCGSVYPIIPDFIEIGIDILNPVQPLATDMDPGKLKAEFGDEICFHGAIDQQEALPGTVEKLDEEIQLRMQQLKPGGGYIVAPTSNIQDDVPLENILFYYDAIKRYGQYE